MHYHACLHALPLPTTNEWVGAHAHVKVQLSTSLPHPFADDSRVFTTQDMVGKSCSSGMCSPASSGSFEPTHASAATLLRTEAHSSHRAVQHRTVIAAPALAPVSYYPQSLMYPYMAAAQLDGESYVTRTGLVGTLSQEGRQIRWCCQTCWRCLPGVNVGLKPTDMIYATVLSPVTWYSWRDLCFVLCYTVGFDILSASTLQTTEDYLHWNHPSLLCSMPSTYQLCSALTPAWFSYSQTVAC